MTQITLETLIKAPIDQVFDLSLDIDFHKESVSQTQEEAIAGVVTGQIKLGETVTWRGKHLGVWFTHTSILSAYNAPTYFVDEMTDGKFKSFGHEHRFRESETKNETYMTDILSYEVPYGIIGNIINKTLLKQHLTKFLEQRNMALKKALENR